jgi:hypothetical protein
MYEAASSGARLARVSIEFEAEFMSVWKTSKRAAELAECALTPEKCLFVGEHLIARGFTNQAGLRVNQW